LKPPTWYLALEQAVVDDRHPQEQGLKPRKDRITGRFAMRVDDRHPQEQGLKHLSFLPIVPPSAARSTTVIHKNKD